MKSWTRAAALAVAALGLTLGLKVLAAASGGGAAPVPRGETLRRFLVTATGGPVEPVPGGWRFESGGCRLQAFPSGPRGTLDMAATSHARRRDRVAYVYRGQVRDTRPTVPLALDVIGYTLAKPFRAANEPGYVVLIAPMTCAVLPNLPWARLPVA